MTHVYVQAPPFRYTTAEEHIDRFGAAFLAKKGVTPVAAKQILALS